jgi:hypothetical protein
MLQGNSTITSEVFLSSSCIIPAENHTQMDTLTTDSVIFCKRLPQANVEVLPVAPSGTMNPSSFCDDDKSRVGDDRLSTETAVHELVP